MTEITSGRREPDDEASVHDGVYSPRESIVLMMTFERAAIFTTSSNSDCMRSSPRSDSRSNSGKYACSSFHASRPGESWNPSEISSSVRYSVPLASWRTRSRSPLSSTVVLLRSMPAIPSVSMGSASI